MQRLLTGVLGCAFLWLAGCGASTNLNGFLWTSSADEERHDYLYTQARLAYDQGQFDDALTLANKAYDLDPENDDVIVLLANINLSKAGVDPFALAKNLQALNAPSTTLLASSDAAASLAKLTAVMSLSAEDFAALGTAQETTSSVSTYYPVILPVAPSVAREKVAFLKGLDRTIRMICPYIDASAKIAGDIRHTSADCTTSGKATANKSKLHIIWSFAHLGEAIAYTSVLLYAKEKDATAGQVGDGVTDNDGTANTEKRVTKLQATNSLQADVFLAALKETTGAVDSVFSTAADSQLTAILNDFNATSKGFAAVPGLPPKMTKKITEGAENINAVAASVGGASQALRGKMAANLAKKVTAAIDDYVTKLGGADKLEAKQKTEACAAYTDVIKGMPADATPAKPSICP